jgi:hypothetical protein
MDIHLLMSLAAIGAIALGDYTEAAAVVVLFAVAEHWERCSTDKARNAVAAVLMLRPEAGEALELAGGQAGCWFPPLHCRFEVAAAVRWLRPRVPPGALAVLRCGLVLRCGWLAAYGPAWQVPAAATHRRSDSSVFQPTRSFH